MAMMSRVPMAALMPSVTCQHLINIGRWGRVDEKKFSKIGVMGDYNAVNVSQVSKCHSVTVDCIKPFEEMPGPKGWPFIGTMWDYLKKDGYRFKKMFEVLKIKSEIFGPVYKETIGWMTSVIVSDLDEYSKVIRGEGRYPKRFEMEPMVHFRKKRGLTLGSVNSQGVEWYRHRSVLAKKLLIPKDVAAFVEPMSVVSDDFMMRLRGLRDENGHVPQVEHEIFKWAMESIGTYLFEDRIGCFSDNKSAHDFIENLMGYFKNLQLLMYDAPIYKYIPTPTWNRFARHADKLLDIGMGFIIKKVDTMNRQSREGVKEGETKETSSFIRYLLEQKSLTPQEVNSHILDALMGGIETTSNATLWVLYCLACNPQAQDAVYQEVMSVLPVGEQITADTLEQIPYIKACLKETFRLYPITFATSRFIPEDLEIGGYMVPAGTHVQANLFGIGRNEKLFPNHLVYDPTRWLRSARECGSEMMLTNLVWGHGARMCIGRRIAEQEIYINLIKMIQNFHLDYKEEAPQPVLNTVMTPDRPLRLILTPRRPTM